MNMMLIASLIGAFVLLGITVLIASILIRYAAGGAGSTREADISRCGRGLGDEAAAAMVDIAGEMLRVDVHPAPPPR